MITDNTPENVQATIVTPINTPIFQNMSLANPVVNQQEQVHMQTQVQEYEPKEAISASVINETTLKIYFPWVPDTDLALLLISASSSKHFTKYIVASQAEAINSQGPPL